MPGDTLFGCEITIEGGEKYSPLILNSGTCNFTFGEDWYTGYFERYERLAGEQSRIAGWEEPILERDVFPVTCFKLWNDFGWKTTLVVDANDFSAAWDMTGDFLGYKGRGCWEESPDNPFVFLITNVASMKAGEIDNAE